MARSSSSTASSPSTSFHQAIPLSLVSLTNRRVTLLHPMMNNASMICSLGSTLALLFTDLPQMTFFCLTCSQYKRMGSTLVAKGTIKATTSPHLPFGRSLMILVWTNIQTPTSWLCERKIRLGLRRGGARDRIPPFFY